MGGKIDVYSEKGKGSAFVVTVPLKTAKEDRRRTERTTYQEYDFSGKRVLLVEDNEINIEITRNILIHKNFMVDIAENGKAGVEQFLKHVKNCPACREELEIYYTVSVGLWQLDSGNGVYDIAGSLEESMENAWLTVRTARLRKVICYAANTLNVASVLIMLFMQIRIWIQG